MKRSGLVAPNPGTKDKTMKNAAAEAMDAGPLTTPSQISADYEHTQNMTSARYAAEGSASGVVEATPGAHFVRQVRAQHTDWYVYAWRGGPQVLHSRGVDRPVLTASQAKKLNDLSAAHRWGLEAPREQSLGWLIRQWKSSPEWKAFSTNTRTSWATVLANIDRKWGKRSLMEFYNEAMIPEIIAWRNSRAKTPRAADTGVSVLQGLLKFGRFKVGSLLNIAAGIPTLYRKGTRAEIIWLDEDIEQFIETANRLGRRELSDVIRLAASTGLRRSDLVELNYKHLRPAAIFKKALKKSGGRRRHLTIPRVPGLDALLQELDKRPRASGVQTILVNARGEPWNAEKLTRDFAIVRDAANIVHVDAETGRVRNKHLHDLRGTFATKLIMQTDLSDQEIARIMGWSPSEVEVIRMIYVDQDAYATALGNRMTFRSVG